MNNFFKQYKFGFDLLALVFCVAVLAPEIVYSFIPSLKGLETYRAVDIFARVFQAAGCILLIFLVLQEPPEKKPFFDSLYLTASLSLMLGYAAWILFFCGVKNFAVLVFLKVCPCVTLLLVAFEKKNYFAAVPLGLYALLQIIPFIVGVITGAVVI